VSNTEEDSSWGGSQGWIVDNVTLFTTTIVLAGTGERATISNGALAKSRIINGARSPKALLYITLKIGLDVPYQKIEIFKSAVEKFVKARPREWLSLAAFRVSGIYAEQNYVEYSIVLQVSFPSVPAGLSRDIFLIILVVSFFPHSTERSGKTSCLCSTADTRCTVSVWNFPKR
jgi:hypothetical protein